MDDDQLLVPDLKDVPEDDKAEPKNADVEHLISEDDVEAQA